MRPFLLLYALALLVRLALGALYPDPAYPDSSYYVDVARALAATGRLELDFIWIFAEVGGDIPAAPVLPVPANAHWLPLASFLQAPFIALLGPTPLASLLPTALVGALAAPLTLAIARDAGAVPAVQIGAGVLAAVPAMGTVFMAQPENFALLQPLVAGALWLGARGLRGSGAAFALAGLLVGLASLARNDGFLIGAALALLFLVDRVNAVRTQRPPRISLRAAVGCAALFLLVMAPWYVRQLLVFGSLSPTSSSGYALWIRSFDEWNSITADPSLSRFLGQGAGAILQSRLDGLIDALGQFAVIVCALVLVPFLLIGAWQRRHALDFRPWFVYFAVLVVVGAALLYPVHVRGGAFIHTAVGLGPHAYVLALEGVVAAIGWLAARRTSWDPTAASRVLVAGIVGLVAATGLLYALPLHAEWDRERQPRVALANELDRRGVGREERLLTGDPPGFKYFTGRGGVVTPNDPIETIEAVATAYRPRWLVLERGGTVDALEPVLEGRERPSWIGPPTFAIPAADGGAPRLALYPVCTEPTDDRCAWTGA